MYCQHEMLGTKEGRLLDGCSAGWLQGKAGSLACMRTSARAPLITVATAMPKPAQPLAVPSDPAALCRRGAPSASVLTTTDSWH